MKIHQTKDPKKKNLRLELHHRCLLCSCVREIWVCRFWYLKNNRSEEEQEERFDNEEQRNDLTTNRDEVSLGHLQQQRRRRDRGMAQIVTDAHVLLDIGDVLGSRRCSNGRVRGCHCLCYWRHGLPPFGFEGLRYIERRRRRVV